MKSRVGTFYGNAFLRHDRTDPTETASSSWQNSTAPCSRASVLFAHVRTDASSFIDIPDRSPAVGSIDSRHQNSKLRSAKWGLAMRRSEPDSSESKAAIRAVSAGGGFYMISRVDGTPLSDVRNCRHTCRRSDRMSAMFCASASVGSIPPVELPYRIQR